MKNYLVVFSNASHNGRLLLFIFDAINFTHYLFMIFISFNTDIYKPPFATYSEN